MAAFLFARCMPVIDRSERPGQRGCKHLPGPAVNPSLEAWVRHPCLTQSREVLPASLASLITVSPALQKKQM